MVRRVVTGSAILVLLTGLGLFPCPRACSLALPKHFGRNLDALWDLLSADVEGPFEIVWKQADASKKAFGRDFDRAVSLLRQLAEERDDFKLKIKP